MSNEYEMVFIFLNGFLIFLNCSKDNFIYVEHSIKLSGLLISRIRNFIK